MQRKVSIALGLIWAFIIIINLKVMLRLYVNYQEEEVEQMLWQVASTVLVTNAVAIYVITTIRQQKKINEIKNDFISNMTHELKTPITVASSAIDAVLNHHGLEDKEKAVLFLKTSKEELLHLNALVERILSLSLEAQKELKLRFEIVNLNAVLTMLIENHVLASGRKIEFDFDTQTQVIEVKADRLHLANAFNNLLDNAVKYANDPVCIRITCKQEGKYAVISIQDNGVGIDRKYIPDIFTPFFRVPQGNLHNIKGYGLGLSYVKNIIEMHGGSVKVKSKLNEGSLFTISLPSN